MLAVHCRHAFDCNSEDDGRTRYDANKDKPICVRREEMICGVQDWRTGSWRRLIGNVVEPREKTVTPLGQRSSSGGLGSHGSSEMDGMARAGR